MKKYIIVFIITFFLQGSLFCFGDDPENFPQQPGNVSEVIEHDTLVGIKNLWFVGLKAGIGLANINAVHEGQENKTFDPIFSFSGGIRGYFYLRKADVRVIVDIDYIKKGAREYGNEYDLHFVEFSFIGSKRVDFLFLGIGLYLGYRFSASLSENGISYPEDKYRENDVGIVISITAYFGKMPRYFFGLDIKYSLVDIVNDDINGSWIYMNAGIYFTVGIGIGD